MADFEDASDYTVRWYNPDDREAFLALYADTFGGGSEEWFRWKYVDNPRVAHVPILVATADGELAGTRAQTPFLMRAGDETRLAMRFGDTMVHPDHRRRGVFSRLVERALDHYREMPVRFCYNVPNDLSRPGFLKAGGEVVTDLPSFYRVQDPSELADAVDDRTAALAGRIGGPGASAYLDARDRLASAPENTRVVRHATIPTDRLVDLYERRPPRTVHAVRDRAFVDWRYRNPDWTYRAYSASVDGHPAAAVVTGTRTEDGVTTTHLVDALPLAPTENREAGFRALLAAITDEFRDSDLLAYTGTAIPRSVLGAHGFLSDGRFPLDRVTSPTHLVAYDLATDAPAWSLGDVDLQRPDAWGFTDVELDAR